MKILKNILSNIVSGEKIDLYITLLAAIVLSILSILGIITQTLLLPIILATLVLLTISNLVNRNRLDNGFNNLLNLTQNFDKLEKKVSKIAKLKNSADLYFKTRVELPPLAKSLSNAKTIDILGSSLLSLSTAYQPILKNLKDIGAKIRLIISNPENEFLQNAITKCHDKQSPFQHVLIVKTALENFKSLVGENDNGGNVELRVTDQFQSFSYLGTDVLTSKGQIQIEFYLNEVGLQRDPVFILNALTDSHWYNEFREQFEIFWINSKNPYTD